MSTAARGEAVAAATSAEAVRQKAKEEARVAEKAADEVAKAAKAERESSVTEIKELRILVAAARAEGQETKDAAAASSAQTASRAAARGQRAIECSVQALAGTSIGWAIGKWRAAAAAVVVRNAFPTFGCDCYVIVM